MLQVEGNIWDYHNRGEWIGITTSGTVTPFGRAVMGKGIALQARRKYPWLPNVLATRLRSEGNRPHVFPEIKIVTIPSKRDWWETSNVELIADSCKALSKMRNVWGIDKLFTVRLGCGEGKLEWEQVEPVVSKLLDNHFVIVQK